MFAPPPPATAHAHAAPGAPRVHLDADGRRRHDRAVLRRGDRAVEALAGKLVELERRPDDARAAARRVPRPAHGQGQLRDGRPRSRSTSSRTPPRISSARSATRAAPPMAPVVDALLAALDALRDMLAQARARGADHRRSGAGRRAPAQPGRAAVVAGAARRQRAGTARGHADRDQPRPRARRSASTSTSSTACSTWSASSCSAATICAARSPRSASITARARRRSRRRAPGRARAQRRGGGTRAASTTLGEELSRVERVLADVTDRARPRHRSARRDLRRAARAGDAAAHGPGRAACSASTCAPCATSPRSLGKRARLELVGDDTELDKLLVEALDEPLMHLVRNAVDHGLELPDVRDRRGQARRGRGPARRLAPRQPGRDPRQRRRQGPRSRRSCGPRPSSGA